MSYPRLFLLAALAVLPLAAGAQAPGNTDCRRLAHAGDEKIQLYCARPANTPGAAASGQNPAGTSCRRLIQPGEKKIHRFCGDTERWDAFDSWAVHAEVTCRWAATSDELCLSPVQWEGFDEQKNRVEAAAADKGQAPPPIDEVTVGATRTLTELRKQIDLAQDRLISKYNELNKVPEFSIACEDNAPTGSRFLRHQCVARFSATATAGSSREFLNGVRGEMGAGSMPSAMLIASKQRAFQKNMADIASKSPELRKLAQEHAGLEERYNQLLRNTLGPDE